MVCYLTSAAKCRFDGSCIGRLVLRWAGQHQLFANLKLTGGSHGWGLHTEGSADKLLVATRYVCSPT